MFGLSKSRNNLEERIQALEFEAAEDRGRQAATIAALGAVLAVIDREQRGRVLRTLKRFLGGNRAAELPPTEGDPQLDRASNQELCRTFDILIARLTEHESDLDKASPPA